MSRYQVASSLFIAAAGLMLAGLGGCSAAGYFAQQDEAPPAPPMWNRTPQPAPADPPAAADPGLRQDQLDRAYDRIYANEYVQAIAILQRLAANTGPGDPIGPQVMLWLGWCRQESGDREGAQAAYQKLLDTWPADRNAPRARRWLDELK
ncbi:MAG: hypothetical protein BIFFINMI_01708 [Phycisphaerae bacterium]|nr:hypothetical protein [Phycisphaerae bacterium]